MPRIIRGLGDNIVYHVINRGNGRQEVFHKEKDYEAFLKIVEDAKERHPVKLYGYCLMPNHYDFLHSASRSVLPEHVDSNAKIVFLNSCGHA